ncbi:LuxR C-terminal-related transcriptional regulator [Actinoplanes sp. NPDC051633]|uniref:helix-turn-helix transcriptional regulator n=1 Tax=Actinoplanes sp. NPDC051633 TaxID=3155670 RepID=UPI003420D55D
MARSAESSTGDASVPSLVCFGCSRDADLTYRHLARNGPATAESVANDLKMDRRRAINTLDELETISAAKPRPSSQERVAAWTVHSPASVVHAVHQQASSRDRCVDRSGESLREQPLPLADGLRHLPNRASTRARLAELVSVARHEQLAMHPEAVFDSESIEAAAPMDRELLVRGIHMRVLGVQTEDTSTVDHRLVSVAARPDYRHAPKLPTKLIIMDRKIALFPVAPGDLERGYLEVSQPSVVDALVALFERHWNQAAELERCSMPHVDLTSRERALVALLAQGHTDATAARELRVSPRSVSNMLRSLMDRLQVDNRFQLGLALGAAHAVPAPAKSNSTNQEP